MRTIVLGLALGAALLSGCSKDKKKDDERGVTVPAAERVIPSNFHNDRDEAGFKAKLPETRDVLQNSTAGLSLHNDNVPQSSETKKFHLTRGLIVSFAKRLNIPSNAQKSMAGASGVHF